MEPSRFDTLTRLFARPASRRRTLAGVVAAALAPRATEARPEPAKCLSQGKRCRLVAHDPQQGQGQGKHGGKGGKGKHHPPSCAKCCSRSGAAGSDGKARCACKPDGQSCANPAQCCGGMCKNGQCTKCAGDLTACNGNCVDLRSDDQHCGDCATACARGQRCLGGACGCDGTSCPRGCCQNGSCQRGTDDNACGVNGADCQTCATCTTCDGTACVNATACCGDASVCQNGTCVACGDGQRCQHGQCGCDATSCPNGCCDGEQCVPYAQQSNERCGTGGAACAACTGNDTCGGGGTPGVCGCTASCSGKCAGAPNGCDGVCPDDSGCVGCCDAATRTCSPCPTGAACDDDGACQSGQCINHACGSSCAADAPIGAICGSAFDAACQCQPTVEAPRVCLGVAKRCGSPICNDTSDCPHGTVCWKMQSGVKACLPLCNVDPYIFCS